MGMEHRHKNGHRPSLDRHQPRQGVPTFVEPLIDKRALLMTLRAIRKGDFSARMPAQSGGVAAEIADVLNDIVETNQRLALELSRISRVVGKEGRLAQRMSIGPVSGAWQSS